MQRGGMGWGGMECSGMGCMGRGEGVFLVQAGKGQIRGEQVRVRAKASKQ